MHLSKRQNPDPIDWCLPALSDLDERGLRRRPPSFSTAPGPQSTIEGKTFLQFASNNYLGLANDARLIKAACDATAKWGTGAASSRLVSGTLDLHLALESALARLNQCESAVLFSSGYLANVAAITATVGPGDALFSDELNHASVIDGCRLSGAEVRVFRHKSASDLESALESTPARRRLVVTDSIFSMTGDLADLSEISRICRERNAMLMVDEAHATGLLGPSGAGGLEASGLAGRADIVTGTLSKALGAAGGFVAGNAPLAEWIRNKARTYIFDTAPPAGPAAAALAAVGIIGLEPDRRANALHLARRLAQGLRSEEFSCEEPSAAIVGVLIGEPGPAMDLSKSLLEMGVFAPAIRPPSVPPGACRIRLTVMATHTRDQIDRVVKAFKNSRPGRHLPTRAPAAGATPHPKTGETSETSRLDSGMLRAGGVFITGTGTGVGKTIAAAGLARTLRLCGIPVAAMKPVQTGVDQGDNDLEIIAAAGAIPQELLSAPYSFGPGVSPKMAALMSQQSIEVGKIIEEFERLKRLSPLVIVEGAGGLLAPLTPRSVMAEVPRALNLPLVIVASPSLGTLNHTALTVESARARGLEIIGIVLSGFPQTPDLAEATNPREIELLTNEKIVGVIPKLGRAGDRAVLPEDPSDWYSPALGGTFDRRSFFEALLGSSEIPSGAQRS